MRQGYHLSPKTSSDLVLDIIAVVILSLSEAQVSENEDLPNRQTWQGLLCVPIAITSQLPSGVRGDVRQH